MGTLAGVKCRALLAALLVIGAAGCGSDGSSGPGAAEPATAPPTSAAPVGRVARVGDRPEGAVFDPQSGLLAVAVRKPDRLLLLDPDTLAVRRTVPLPGKVRHLQLGFGGGSVLVPVESANRIVQVSLPSGTIRSTKVRKQPHDAAETGNGDVVVGDEFGRSISIVRDGRVRRTFTDLDQPGGVVATGQDSVAVVDVGAFTVSTYDLRTLKRTGRRPAGKGPTHGVALSGGRLLVADTRGNRMLVFDDAPLRLLGSLTLPGTPYGMTYDARSRTAWITLTARNQVVGLDVRTDTPRVIARYPTVRQPNTVAVDPGARTLWVAGADAGVVQRIDR